MRLAPVRIADRRLFRSTEVKRFVSKSSGFLPTLLVDPDELAAVAIVVGDQQRARDAATRLTDAREIGSNREYVTWTGNAGDQRIVVASHGVGAAGANVGFSELLRGGVTTFIRAGSCGAISEGIEVGDVVLASAAVREARLPHRSWSRRYMAPRPRGS